MLDRVKTLRRYKLTREYEIELFWYYKQHGNWDQERLTEKDLSL